MDELNETPGVLVAQTVYALMNHRFHVSRNERTQWYFHHLNKKIQLPPDNDGHFQLKTDSEIEILSIYPYDAPKEWGPSNRHNYQYLITQTTNVVYLSKVNKAVYCIDMSPSMSVVDLPHGQVMLDEIPGFLKNSIEGAVKSFVIPGTTYLFKPNLFVTVIVHTPFFTTPAQQVLVQGWRVTSQNVNEFLSAIFKQLELLEDTIAAVSRLVHDEIDERRYHQAESDRLVGGLFEEVPEKQVISTGVSMVNPDLGFINLLRYGMLALRLLPQSSLSNLIVITDGMINLPDIQVLESVLSQLRSNAVAVSFLHVGSQFHQNCCPGLVSYSELLQFIANATVGAYFSSIQRLGSKTSYNVYHEAFITWSLRRRRLSPDLRVPLKNGLDRNETNVTPSCEPILLTKKHCEEQLTGSLSNVLCCRLHEGYLIKDVLLRDSKLEIVMVLPWAHSIYIEYIIRTNWPEIKGSKNIICCMVCIKAPYEFLNDITSQIKKSQISPYRQAKISRFWCTLKTLTHTDKFLSHLDTFPENSATYTVPDSLRNGMPLCYLPSSGAHPELTSSGSSCSQLAQFWRPVVMLEPSVWPKWFHTHRLGLILQPDQVLPHVLHTISSSSRANVLQCRLAESALYSCLKKLTSFSLIENHSYIKILSFNESEVSTPKWFYIVRITSKPPCTVIHIAFLAGTPGHIRHQVVETIREEITKLKIPQRGDPVIKRNELDINFRSEVECCTIVKKPLEKILIRYERMPCEFSTVVFPDGTQPDCSAKPLKPTSSLVTTLSRYLHHKRSIWNAHTPSASHNNLLTMLTTLTRMRLHEGFLFSHCSAGIINMVLEVQMKCFDDEDDANECAGRFQPCVIQYVLFPPHNASYSTKSSASGEDTGDEAEVELRTELVTECWIEPQHGIVQSTSPNQHYTDGLHYHQIADYIWMLDAECISNLLTFDHLQLMCHNQEVAPPLALDPSSHHNNPLEKWPHAVAIEDERIHRIPFAYNLMNVLPKCQQAELLNDMFVQVLTDDWTYKARNDAPNNLLMENILTQLRELHHRELHLSEHESAQMLQLIINRPRDVTRQPIPFASVTKEGPETTSKPVPGSHGPKRLKPAIPKWRCFVKSMASTHCVLTFVPASLHDLKILMLASDCKMFKHFDSQESDSRESEVHSKMYSVSENDSLSIRNNPCGNSKCSSTQDIDSHYGEEDVLFDSIPHRDCLYIDKYDQPFRTRASSLDTMKKQNESLRIDPKRIRTSSVGSKMKPANIIKTVVENQIEYSGKIDDESAKPVCGSITLPMYVYDCPLSNLVDALISKEGFERRADIFHNDQSDDASSSPDEMDLHHHCRVINQAFSRCFVMALFKSLHLNYRINSHDINTAVRACNDTLLQIDITKYLQTICGHFKHSINKSSRDSDLEQSFSLPCLPREMLPLQKLIKRRFLEILTVCYKPVPASPDFFYCRPPSQTPRMVDTGYGSQRTEFDFDASTIQSDAVAYLAQQNCIGLWDRGRLDMNVDGSRTPLPSTPDTNSEHLMDMCDELFPLFLHLVCSVSSSDRGLGIVKVKGIPTCFCDLLSNAREAEGVDLSSLKVTLDMHCLTLPPSYPSDLPQNNGCCTQDANLRSTNPCDLVQHDYANVIEASHGCEQLQHLPDHQHNAINKCISEIEWFLQDEIALFLLNLQPISKSALDLVVNHVTNSRGRPSCLMSKVPLDFVYGVEQSMKKFVDVFSRMKIQGYQLQKLDDYYYLTKISNQQPPASQGVQHFLGFDGNSSINNESCLGDKQLNSKRYSCDLKNEFCDPLGKEYFASKFKWIKELSDSRPSIPNFWLIMKIDEAKVNIYFHCKFLDYPTDEVQRYKDAYVNAIENIERVCKTVNQMLLLFSLHETRMCDPLLEPEEPEKAWNPNTYMKFVEDNSDMDIRGENSDLSHKYHPGWFSCRVVWQAHFVLHPRLKTGPGIPGLSRAIQALRTILNRFSVNNRANMFVYKDSSGSNVFYLRLNENIRSSLRNANAEDDNSPGSVSRSSSINSLTNKRVQEDMNKDMRPRLKSFGENYDAMPYQEDILTLKVHGIADAGAEVTHELVQVLQNRLDDAVLEVVSVMLARNPMCKLTPDDVHFIQKPHHQAAHIIQFSIPQQVHDSLDSLAYYLKQNLLQFLFMPKYTDTRHIFQDYSQPEGSSCRISESNIYLYNQSPVTGNKGIACLAVAIVDKDGNIVSNKDSYRGIIVCDAQALDAAMLQEIQVREIDVENNETEPSIAMEVRLWKPGRVNMDLLIQKLKNILQFSLWDLITEYSILTIPIKEKINDGTQEVIGLNHKFYESIPTWLQSGCVLNVPAVKLHTIELPTRHPIGVIIREMGHIISLHEPMTSMFIEEHSSDGVYMLTNEPDSTSISKCFIISNSGYQPSQEYSEDHKDFKESSHKPGGGLQFLPRQRFFIAIISNLKVLAYMYNWPKDRVEDLSKLMTQLGVWLCSRSSFLCGAYLQKMGLFHNQPLSRKLKTQNATAECLDLENLLTFTPNATPRKTAPNMAINVAHILRDTNSAVAFASKINFSGLADPVAASIDQIMSIKASDRKEQQDKLHVMWQSRGITPYIPLSDDTLSLFLRNARVFHFCLTPFVFHPRWRVKNSCFLRDQKTGFSNNFTESCNEDFSWHHSVCVQFLNAYKHYLQTLGYILVQTAPSTPRKLRKEKFLENEGEWKLYMQKSLIGGIVMLEISIIEPFLQIKLLGIECARLQPKPLNNLILQIVLNFTEECSKVTNTVRLQSFTYDYHLKCLERYLLGQTSYLPRDYHVTMFLDDFLKFYSNTPASSNCCLHMGVSVTPNISTSPAQLYDFLLGHEKDYGMEVVRMINNDGVSRSNIYKTVQENEFVLVKHQADVFENNNSGGDPQAHLKDMNLTLVISCDKFSTGMTIRLNYFLILTSSRLESYSSQQSAPDQVLANVLADQAAKAKIEIEQMVIKGSLDCRIHLLWNRLLCNSPSNSLSYSSLYELKSLAHIETFIDIDPNLKSLLDQPFQWYQSLVKTLTNKYSSDKCKIFSSPDGTVHHLLILHPRFLDGFVSLTLDHSVNQGALSIVYRQTDKRKRDLESECIQSLVEGVINACCYHTWLSLLNS